MHTKSYHVEKTGNAFEVFVSIPGGHNQHAQERVIAFGVLNDPAAFDEVIRLCAHANVSLAMQHAIDVSATIENAATGGPRLF